VCRFQRTGENETRHCCQWSRALTTEPRDPAMQPSRCGRTAADRGESFIGALDDTTREQAHTSCCRTPFTFAARGRVGIWPRLRYWRILAGPDTLDNEPPDITQRLASPLEIEHERSIAHIRILRQNDDHSQGVHNDNLIRATFCSTVLVLFTTAQTYSCADD